jgi:hypothetical protein
MLSLQVLEYMECEKEKREQCASGSHLYTWITVEASLGKVWETPSQPIAGCGGTHMLSQPRQQV